MRPSLSKYFALISVAILLLAAVLAFANLQGTYSGPPTLLDPEFKLWTNAPGGPQLMVWTREIVRGPNDQAVSNQRETQGKNALELGIYQSGSAGWVYESLTETLDGSRVMSLLNGTVGIWMLKEPCSCDRNPYNKTAVTLALDLNDGLHSLSFLFSDSFTGALSLPNQKIVFVPTPSGVWSYQQLNVREEFASSHWPIPSNLRFSLVFGVAAGAVGWHYSYLNSVTVSRGGVQNILLQYFLSKVATRSMSVILLKT